MDTCIVRRCCFLRIRTGLQAIISVLSARLQLLNFDCTMRVIDKILMGGLMRRSSLMAQWWVMRGLETKNCLDDFREQRTQCSV